MNVLVRLPCGPLRPRLAARLLAAWFAVVLAALAGCGPTGGGTGTGEGAIALADFGATPASACTAPFAGALSCTADAVLLPGTGRVLFAGIGADAHVVLILEGNRAELESRCSGERFEGTWGRLPGGETRYFGSDDGAPAQLELQLQPGRDDVLSVSLLDGAGRAVLGPLLVQRVAVLPADPACR